MIVIAIAVALGVAFAVAVQLAFNSGWVVAFVYPLAALVLASVGSLAVQLVTEAFERIRAVDLFARFVPENVVDQVLASADGLRLGGVQRERHGDVHRPARLHLVLGEAHAVPGDRRPQPLPERDVRRDPR